MHSRRLILRHALVSLSFVLLYVLLNRPEVILLSRLGFITWYPAIGLVMALLLGVSPWYALLVCLSDAVAGRIIYGGPLMSFGNTFGAAREAPCVMAQRPTYYAGKCKSIWGCVAARMWSATLF